MNTTRFGRRFLMGLAGLVLVFGMTALVSADPIIKIQFSGLNLVYDGSQLCDAGGCVGGNGDPSEADSLVTMSFLDENDNPIAPPLLTDIAADIRLNVSGIPADGGFASGSGDIFDLLTQSGTPGWGLALNVSDFDIAYFDSLLTIFGAGTTNDIYFQDLPYELAIGTPILFSFEVQIDPLTLTDDGEVLTGFAASGTGQVQGPNVVPEPASLVLLGSGLLGLGGFARKRRP